MSISPTVFIVDDDPHYALPGFTPHPMHETPQGRERLIREA